MTRYTLVVFFGFVPLIASAQVCEPCYVDLAHKLKSSDVAGANRILYGGGCDFRCKDEFGDDQKEDKEDIKSLISTVRNYLDSCDKVRLNSSASEADIKEQSMYCGSGAMDYHTLEQAEKATGVRLTDFAKTWDKFITDRKTAMVQKEEARRKGAEQRDAENKARAQSPQAFANRICETIAEIAMAKRMIAEEKEVGSVSGVVDEVRLHRAGEAIVADNKALPVLKKYYRERAGKEWSPSLCKR